MNTVAQTKVFIDWIQSGYKLVNLREQVVPGIAAVLVPKDVRWRSPNP